MITVADTSPLRYLILVEAIDVLPRIFGRGNGDATSY